MALKKTAANTEESGESKDTTHIRVYRDMCDMIVALAKFNGVDVCDYVDVLWREGVEAAHTKMFEEKLKKHR